MAHGLLAFISENNGALNIACARMPRGQLALRRALRLASATRRGMLAALFLYEALQRVMLARPAGKAGAAISASLGYNRVTARAPATTVRIFWRDGGGVRRRCRLSPNAKLERPVARHCVRVKRPHQNNNIIEDKWGAILPRRRLACAGVAARPHQGGKATAMW